MTCAPKERSLRMLALGQAKVRHADYTPRWIAFGLPTFHSEQRLPPNAGTFLPFCWWEGLFPPATGRSSFSSARCPWGPCRR